MDPAIAAPIPSRIRRVERLFLNLWISLGKKPPLQIVSILIAVKWKGK